MSSREEFLSEGDRRFFEFVGLPFPYVRPEPNYHPNPDPTKILSLSDLHAPYQHNGVLDLALKGEHDSGCVVIPGDIGDYYSKSRFKKNKVVSFKDEVRSIFLILEWLSVNWREVKVMMGNHDDRPEKTISALFNGATDLLIMTEPNLLKYLCSWFPNVELVGHSIQGEGLQLYYLYQHGDIVFTHAELSRAQKTATLEYISNYLHKWGRTLKVSPWKVIAQGHNHSDLKTSRDGEKWFLLPTASDPYSIGMEYIYNARMGGSPPSVGYTIFHQSNGITDYNKSHNVVIDYVE
jgi:predicted phosphodiesterase